jgi:hypothetical protein
MTMQDDDRMAKPARVRVPDLTTAVTLMIKSNWISSPSIA